MLLDDFRDLTLGRYPFHMPGHKRRLVPHESLRDWYALDLTEIEGADDLHHASGILQDAMDRTSALWGSRRTWYLTCGSTVGILAAIRALAPAGSEILVARNCHRSVWHAVELGMLRPHWLQPEQDCGFGICGSIAPGQVRKALEQNPGCRAVVVTSPTYEGVLSDIRGISDVCHAAGVPLLVDEAHGAHLGLFSGFPESAVRQGADVVIQSAHKTLPAPTQTAFLHLGREALDCVPEREIGRQLDVYETSSPSYPMMGALDAVTALLSERGQELFRNWTESLQLFDEMIRGLNRLRVLCHGADNKGKHPAVFGFDPGKITVSCSGTGMTGRQLAGILRKRFSLEPEMSTEDLVLFMTGCGDDPEALGTLADALCRIDREQGALPEGRLERALFPDSQNSAQPLPAPEVCLSPGEAVLHPAACVSRDEAAGAICGEYIYAYPPGIPLLAPGERITSAVLGRISASERAGTLFRHSVSGAGGRLCILTKDADSMYDE